MGTNDNTGWQPIETAPRDGTLFLAYSMEWIYPDIVKWESKYGHFYANFEVLRCPTLWMPLPALPKADTINLGNGYKLHPSQDGTKAFDNWIAGERTIKEPSDMTSRDDVGICSEHRDPPDHMLWQDNNGRWHEFHGARKPTLAEVEASADVVLIDRESGRPKQVRPVAIRWPNGDEWSRQ